MSFAQASRPRRIRRTGAVLLATALVGLGLAGPAHADDPAPARLTLSVETSPDNHYSAGDVITMTLTATNNTGAPFTLPDGAGLEAWVQSDYDAPIAQVVSGDCAVDGMADPAVSYWIDWAYSFPVSAPLADGASLTCVLSYTASAVDAKVGNGLWLMLTYSSDIASGGWDYSYWKALGSAGTPDLPPITGTAAVGSTLTLQPSIATMFGAPLSYQWLRGSTPIAGATHTTYVPTTADLGAQLSVTITAADIGISWSSTPTAAVGAGHLATVVPVVSGTAKVGSKLTALPGAWKPAGVTYAYQWLRGGVPIAGARSVTYTPAAADLGKALSVRVTGSKAGFTAAAVTSRATAAVKAGTITVSARAKVTGTAKVGRKLTALKPRVSVSGATYTYRWLRSGKAIAGATKSTYVLKAADKGKYVTVKVTVKKTAYTSVSSTSAKAGKVKG